MTFRHVTCNLLVWISGTRVAKNAFHLFSGGERKWIHTNAQVRMHKLELRSALES